MGEWVRKRYVGLSSDHKVVRGGVVLVLMVCFWHDLCYGDSFGVQF